MIQSDAPAVPRRRLGPAMTLVLLSPLIGEVLNGATRLTFIFVFIPEMMVWGCGVLLIREAVHRWRGGWRSVILLGLALSVLVEVLVLQTSVAPIPWLQMLSIPIYDRIWGVNWFWFAFMLGYETVWIVLVPILITALIFPERRDGPWTRRRGLTMTAVIFTVGCVGLWALWTQNAVPFAFHMPKYWPPLATLLLGAVAVLMLIGAGFAMRRVHTFPSAAANAPAPWIAGAAVAILALPWWILIVLVFAPQPSLPVWVPVLAAPLWAAAVWLVVTRWAAAPGWNERHRWALAFAALAICMLMGYLGSSSCPVIDLAAKIVFNAVALGMMIALGRRVWRSDWSANN